MSAEVHKEAHLAVPTEQDAEIVLDRKRPVVLEFALELVRAEQGIARVRREAAQRRSEELVVRGLQLLRPTREPARNDEPHPPGSGPKAVEQLVDVCERGRRASAVFRLSLAHLAQEERPAC